MPLWQEDRGPVTAQDANRSNGPPTLLFQIGRQVHRAKTSGQHISEEDTAPGGMQLNRSSEILCYGVLWQPTNLIKSGRPYHNIGAADKCRIVRRLSRAQRPIKQRLLIVGPARDRVFQIAVILPRLHPPNGWVGE